MPEPTAIHASAETVALPSPTHQPPLPPLSPEAIEAMPYPLAIYTCDGLYVGANSLVEQLFRVPIATLIGRFNFSTDPASRDQSAIDLFRAAVAGQRGQAPLTYYDFSFPDTSAPTSSGCWVETTFLPFRDATGQVTHIGMLFQDVSERVTSESPRRWGSGPSDPQTSVC